MGLFYIPLQLFTHLKITDEAQNEQDNSGCDTYPCETVQTGYTFDLKYSDSGSKKIE